MREALRRLKCRVLGCKVDAFPLPWFGGGLFLSFCSEQETCRRCHRRVLWSVSAHD